jgi:hypothetical protein
VVGDASEVPAVGDVQGDVDTGHGGAYGVSQRAVAGTLTDWHEANQRHVARALDRMRVVLTRHIARTSGTEAGTAAGAMDLPPYEPGPGQEATTVGSAAPVRPLAPMALDALAAKFNLSPVERDLIVLCAGVELDAKLAQLCGEAQGDSQRRHPTFSLALAALPGAHWSAVTPASPIRRWRLVNLDAPDRGLTTSALHIDERVLHFLAGVSHLEERLVGLVEPVNEAGPVVPSHRAIGEKIVALWRTGSATGYPPIIQLMGESVSDKRLVAALATAGLGLRLFVLPAAAVPLPPADVETLIRLWEREAALSGAALLVDCSELEESDAARSTAVAQVLDRTWGALLVATRERRRFGRREHIGIDVPKPTSDEQRNIWNGTLGAAAARMNGEVDQLVSQFNLSAQAIRSVAIEVAGTAPSLEPAGGAREAERTLARALWDGCRGHARPRLEGHAQRIDSVATWHDLVLPGAQRQILHDIAAHVRQRAVVYERWGFGSQGSRGLGISALFAGSSGTGKTMAAEVLANELRLDLYRIDLSSVVSKYIGETEKNLRKIFDAAEYGGAILLFDEADALFGKRSEVKDSHDRYANIEVSYLLQRMESYRGLAILTTNLRNALDTAFLRRIRFIVQFPFPDPEQRAEIWRRVFPKKAPLEGVSPERLAQLDVAGGNIRSIALNAAFLAADAGEPVRMSHLLHAARTEYAKLEKPLTDTEIEGWE